jgi:mono/diheme cytochrome c family protein
VTPIEPNNPLPEPFSDPDRPDEMNVGQVHDSILREQAEPRDGYEPIPLWLVTVFFVIIFWAGMYLAYNSGGFEANVFNPDQVSWAGGGGAAAGPPDPKVLGKRLFTANCVVCHQSSGQGVPGQFPPLAGSEWVLAKDWAGDNHVVSIVLHGLQGPVQVAGGNFNNAMPPWKQLNDEQIAAILTYVRSEWGNDAPPITPEYVARMREQTADRTEPWSQKELQAIGREMISEAAASPAPEEGSQPPAAEPPPPAVEPPPAANPTGA